jgi:hypothetical protein
MIYCVHCGTDQFIVCVIDDDITICENCIEELTEGLGE